MLVTMKTLTTSSCRKSLIPDAVLAACRWPRRFQWRIVSLETPTSLAASVVVKK
jgi:hypothetical protein